MTEQTQATEAERQEDRIWMDGAGGPPLSPEFSSICREVLAKVEGGRLEWRARFEVDPKQQMGRIPVDSGGWWLSGTGRPPFYPGMEHRVTFAAAFAAAFDGQDDEKDAILRLMCYHWNPKVLGEKAGYWETKFSPMGAASYASSEWVLAGRSRCPFTVNMLYEVTMLYVGEAELE